MSTHKKELVRGTLWSVGGQTIALGISLLANIWLARLLNPKDFGQIGIILFFIIISRVISESGLAGALIRKKNASKLDYSTVFIVNVFISLFCFILLVLFSGNISNYYNDPLLKNLLIGSSFVLLINAFQVIQNAKLISEMRFKQKSFYWFLAILISSITGVLLAYNGFGVWSIVIMQLLNSAIYTILLWIFEGFYFYIKFSKKSFLELYSFGLNTTLASLLNVGFDNIYQLVLGKYFSITQVGFYYQAKRLNDVPGGVINLLSQGVVFSSLSKLHDNKEKFIRYFSKISLFFTVLLGLISLLVYVFSEQIILFLFGEKWMSSVFFLKLLTVASFFYFQDLINRVIFKVFDKTKQILYLEILKKAIQLVSIVIGVIYLDLQILLFGFVISSFLSFLMIYYFSRKVINHINNKELFKTFAVVLLVVFLILVFKYIENVFNLTGYNTVIILPLLIFAYFFLLKYFRIYNMLNNLKLILKF